jgi:hypothetical protein
MGGRLHTYEDAYVDEIVDVDILIKYNYPITLVPFSDIKIGAGFIWSSIHGIKITDNKFINLLDGAQCACFPDNLVYDVLIEVKEHITEITDGQWYLTTDGPAFAFEQLLWIFNKNRAVVIKGTKVLRPLDASFTLTSISASRIEYADMKIGQAFLCNGAVMLKAPQGYLNLLTGNLGWSDGSFHTVEIEIND